MKAEAVEYLEKICNWYNGLSQQVRDSITYSVTILGFFSTLFSILGVSLGNWENSNILIRLVVVVLAFIIIYIIICFAIGKIFKNSVKLTIRQTPISISYGDIFKAPGWKVIGCDTHFDTRIDDVIISKKSLHGQLVMNHGNKDKIDAVVKSEAKRLGIKKNNEGLYDFPLGTVIRYDSSVDNQTYLMVATTELNAQHEAHTNMAKFELMLMKMWAEINRVYASNDIVLPLLCAGISRFDDGPKEKAVLLKCMLCTLNSSGVNFKSQIGIIIYGDARDIPMYEYKNMFHTIIRG